MNTKLLVLFATCTLFSACKEEEPPPPEEGEQGDPCDPESEEGEDACAEGLSCEQLASGEGNVCGTPLEIRGMVIDALSEAPIEGAHVLALDNSSAPVSDVAVTDAEGRYSLAVSAPRNDDGTVIEGVIYTLGASADDYQIYPGGVRPAFPVDASNVMTEGGETGETGEVEPAVDYVENESTTVALIPLEDASGRTISGEIVGGDGAGALIVAEGGGEDAPYAIADLSGAYTVFNVPEDAGELVGYRAGLAITPAGFDAGSEDLTLDLSVGEDSLATVSGSINIVNPGDGTDSSVVLVPASVFSPIFERGAVPFGLRAPEPGIAPNVGGAFEIADVPPGTYKVLAAFENDFLVRDPDESIAGTDIVEITVAGEDITVQESFKVTGALRVTSPGAENPEVVTTAPTFEWNKDSGEDRYELVVFDARGNVVWSRDDIPKATGSDPSVPYEGPALEDGMYYQFRAWSVADTNDGPVRRSATEDLRGVFVFNE